MRIIRVLALVGCTLLALNLAGCSGGAEPTGGAEATKPLATDPQDVVPGSDAGADAAGPTSHEADAAPTADTCDLSKPFGAPVPIGLEITGHAFGIANAAMTPDEKAFIVNRTDVDALHQPGFMTYARPTRTAPFAAPVIQLGLNGKWSPANEGLWVSPDALTAYVASSVAEHSSPFDIKRIVRATRPNVSANWVRDPAIVPGLAPDGVSSVKLYTPFVVGGGTTLYYAKNGASVGGIPNNDLYRTSLPTTAPAAITELNTSEDEGNPVLTADQLTIYWATTRGSTMTGRQHQVYTAHRAVTSDPFADIHAVEGVKSVPKSPLSFPNEVLPIAVSPNHCRLYVLESSQDDDFTRIVVASRP